MAGAHIPEAAGLAAVHRALGTLRVDARPPGVPGPRLEAVLGADRPTAARAVRFLLQTLAEKTPGHTVEVRVPPFGAVQCVEGPRHTRGTPPNVVEMSPAIWLALACGRLAWRDAVDAGVVSASGRRADLTPWLPVRSGI